MNTDTNKTIHEKALKTGYTYLLVTIFVAFAGFVYERFSHNVFSYFMLYAFAFPLLGAFVYLTLAIAKVKFYPSVITSQLIVATISTFCVGSIIMGVLEIYGTTSYLAGIYWCVGTVLSLLTAVAFIWDIVKYRRKK